MSRGVGWQSALWARPLYRGPVAKRVAVSAGGASLRSVKKILSEVESLVLVQPGHDVADPGQKQAMPNRLSRIEAPAQRLGFFDSCQVAWDGAE